MLTQFSRTPRFGLPFLLLLLIVLALSGCGGGGGNNNNNNTTRVAGVLDNNSSYDPNNDIYFDLYEFRGKRDGRVTVRATSNDFDTLLGVEDQDSTFSDSNNGSGDNSRLDFDTNRDNSYLVAVGSNDGHFGNYDLEVGEDLEFVNTRRIKASILPKSLQLKMGALRAAQKAAAKL